MGSGVIIIAAVVVGVTGLIIGLLLVMAASKFKVEVDEKELAVRDLLPGNNCGGCGYAGCDALAKAIAEGEAAPNACPVGGSPVAEKISEVLGVSVESAEKQVAYVKCAGTCDVAKDKFIYSGIKDCRDASVVPGKGPKKCAYGCMGFGSCVKACQFDAIHIVNGVAVVDKEKCVSCGKCIETCPNQLIELVPYKAKYLVQCNSQDKGKTLKDNCSAGCLGCTLCVKQCPKEAISMNGNVAKIDYSKCVGCGICAQKCPAKIIRMENGVPVQKKKTAAPAKDNKKESKETAKRAGNKKTE